MQKDKNRPCKQCGHPMGPHTVFALNTKDFSKGGYMTCPVEGCTCYSTISFNIKEEKAK